jgi:hypothetical protein
VAQYKNLKKKRVAEAKEKKWQKKRKKKRKRKRKKRVCEGFILWGWFGHPPWV